MTRLHKKASKEKLLRLSISPVASNFCCSFMPVVHQVTWGIVFQNLRDFFWRQYLFQQVRNSWVESGIIQLMPRIAKNELHNWEVTLQWRKRWFSSSGWSSQWRHLLELKISSLKVFLSEAGLATNQEKQETLRGMFWTRFDSKAKEESCHWRLWLVLKAGPKRVSQS